MSWAAGSFQNIIKYNHIFALFVFDRKLTKFPFKMSHDVNSSKIPLFCPWHSFRKHEKTSAQRQILIECLCKENISFQLPNNVGCDAVVPTVMKKRMGKTSESLCWSCCCCCCCCFFHSNRIQQDRSDDKKAACVLV